MMMQANMFYKIIAVNSLVDRGISCREPKIPSRWKSSRIETYTSFTSPRTLVFVILPCQRS